MNIQTAGQPGKSRPTYADAVRRLPQLNPTQA